MVFVSGYAGEALVDVDLGEPPAAILQKPFTPAALTRAIRERLEARAAGSGPGR